MKAQIVLRCAAGLLLSQVVVAVYVRTEAEELHKGSTQEQFEEDLVARYARAVQVQVDTRGHVAHVHPSDRDGSSSSAAQKVSLHSDQHTAQKLGAGEANEVLLQLQEHASIPMKVVVVCIASIVALIGLCSMGVWLVWQPMSAILMERAFEQAASQALLAAAPKPTAIAGSSQDSQAAALNVTSISRGELLGDAWQKFLENQLLGIMPNNYLARLLKELLGKPAFEQQLEELFKDLADDEGDPDSMTQDQLKTLCDRISGTMYNMHAKESITMVEYKPECECSLAVAAVEDYGWLFDSYDTVFPADAPMDRKSFPGVVSLILAWNCVRTLHTARHMAQEQHDTDRKSSKNSGKKDKVSVQIEIRSFQIDGVPLKADAELDIGDSLQDAGGSASGSADEAAPNGSSAASVEEEDLAP